MSNVEENTDFLSFEMYMRRLNLFESLPVTVDAVVFVGDSLTQRNQWSEFFTDEIVLNRGIDSDRSFGVWKRLDHIISLKPQKIFLMIGINDLFDKRESTINNYGEIIQRLKTELPETKLHIQSVLPVNNSVYGHEINNEDVKALNAGIKQLADENDVTFIDIFTHVVKNDELDEIYTLDGCHLSGKGYEKWTTIIRPFVQESI